MRWRIAIAATAVLFMLSSASLIAQGNGRGGSKAPKPQVPAAKPTQGTKAPAPATAKGTKGPASVKPAADRSGAAKTTANAKATATKGKAGAAAGTTTKSPKATTTAKTTKSAKTTTDATPATSATAATTPSSTTTTTAALSPAQQKLQKNTNLASKLSSRLPVGTDLMEAASGFRNLGQFVAAVNVSNNLGVPFADLKMKMVDEHMSLGQSIQALKPTASGTVEARRAEYDAQGLIYQSEQEQASATSSKKKKTKPSGSGGGSDE